MYKMKMHCGCHCH